MLWEYFVLRGIKRISTSTFFLSSAGNTLDNTLAQKQPPLTAANWLMSNEIHVEPIIIIISSSLTTQKLLLPV